MCVHVCMRVGGEGGMCIVKNKKATHQCIRWVTIKVQRSRYKVHNVAANLAFLMAEAEKLKMSSSSSPSSNSPPPPLPDLLGFGWGLGGYDGGPDQKHWTVETAGNEARILEPALTSGMY